MKPGGEVEEETLSIIAAAAGKAAELSRQDYYKSENPHGRVLQ